MVVMKIGLYAGALAFVGVTWASWSVGYAPELALVRGLFGFMAMSAVGYVGAIVVVTAPRATASPAAAAAPEREREDAEPERAAAASPFEIDAADDPGGGGAEPIPFRPREEAPAAPAELERRAA